MKYLALLRGINVGGNTKVEMAKLKECFEKLGFTEVKTLLNSGNVVFESPENSLLKEKIEKQLEQTFGFYILVLIRTAEEIKKLIAKDPFKEVKITPDIRLYVTFLPEGGELTTAITVSPQKTTTDLMTRLDKKYGKTITTRNWNTVIKIAKLME